MSGERSRSSSAHDQARPQPRDEQRTEDVRAALDQAVEAFGRLDIAFNNAGAEQKVNATADITEEEWRTG